VIKVVIEAVTSAAAAVRPSATEGSGRGQRIGHGTRVVTHHVTAATVIAIPAANDPPPPPRRRPARASSSTTTYAQSCKNASIKRLLQARKNLRRRQAM
jgi:hypothetical protein